LLVLDFLQRGHGRCLKGEKGKKWGKSAKQGKPRAFLTSAVHEQNVTVRGRERR